MFWVLILHNKAFSSLWQITKILSIFSDSSLSKTVLPLHQQFKAFLQLRGSERSRKKHFYHTMTMKENVFQNTALNYRNTIFAVVKITQEGEEGGNFQLLICALHKGMSIF